MVYSTDGIPGAEALSAQKRLAALLSYKLKRKYSEMCGFVQARISLAIVRSNSLLLCGPRNKGAHPAVTRSDGWSGDGTARALTWLNLGRHDGKEVKGRRQGRGTGEG